MVEGMNKVNFYYNIFSDPKAGSEQRIAPFPGRTAWFETGTRVSAWSWTKPHFSEVKSLPWASEARRRDPPTQPPYRV